MIELEVREVHLPFRFQYGHAKKQHRFLQAVICLATDEQGRVGLGEAVPRTYVTGETCASVFEAISRVAHRWHDVPSDAEQMVKQRVAQANLWQGPFPSCAFSTIDTALVDLRAKQQEKSMAEWMGGEVPAELVYTASIGLSKKTKLMALLWLYRALGLRKFKVKVGSDSDAQRIRLIRRVLGSDVELFADANACWDRETAIREIEMLAEFGVWAIEEPLKASDARTLDSGQLDRLSILDDEHYQRYRWLKERSPLPLIADESLICLQSAGRIVEHQAFDILNVRLSKCGGPLLSSQIVAMARAHDMRFSLGAMVGETPILATAGSHFAAAHQDHLYVQGYSHRLLHRTRFVSGEPSNRRGGQVRLAATSGLELQIDHRKLDAVTVFRKTIEP